MKNDNQKLARRMVVQAKSFFSSAKKLQELPIKNGILTESIAPCVVLLAFATEIFLKILILIERDKIARGHALCELFGSLSKNTQDTIRTNINASDFNDQLMNVSNAFVEWRYIHEKEKLTCLNVNFLFKLCKISSTITNTYFKSLNQAS